MAKSKKLLIATVVIELILFIGVAVSWITDSQLDQEMEYVVSGLETTELTDWKMEYSEERSTDISILEVNYGTVSSGIYKIEVNYSVDQDQHVWIVTDGYSIPEELEGVILDHRKHTATYYITNKTKAENFTVRFMYDGGQQYEVNSIHLYKSKRGYMKSFLEIFVLFSILEIAIYLYNHKRDAFKKLILLGVISVIGCLPLLVKGINIGHDFTYHYARIEGIYRELMAGNFPVYFQSIWCDGYGSPVSMYYGDWMLYLPAGLRLFGFDFVIAYKIFIFVVTFFTALIAKFSFNKIFKDERIALLLAFVYVVAPYRLIDIYVRTAVGEYSALMFMPLVIAGYYGIMEQSALSNNVRRKIFNFDRDTVTKINMLAIGMAGLVTCHMLSTEITVFILVACTIIFIRRLSFVKIRAFIAAILEFISMSCFFLVPFVDAYLHNDLEINHTVSEKSYIQYAGIQIGELFAFFKDIFGEGQSYNYGLERMQLSLGLLLTVTIILAIIIIVKRKANLRLKIFTCLTLFTVFMATDVFPWNFLVCYTHIGQILASIQFPWRFLTYATAFAVIVLGDVILVGINFIKEKDFIIRIDAKKVISIAIIVVSGVEILSFNSKYIDGYEPLYSASQVIDTRSPAEYLRYDTDQYAFVWEVTGTNAECVEVGRNGSKMAIYCSTGSKGGTVTVPMQNVIGFTAVDTEGNTFDIVDGENNEIMIELPANYEGTITVKFTPYWYWLAAFVYSLLFILGYIIIVIKNNFKRTKGQIDE